ncbi:MAG: hypothetical protein LBV16_06310 [Elusimicrobiota bacterium]|nr:hypothetical protein [Elusimicrobiota bacterium]
MAQPKNITAANSSVSMSSPLGLTKWEGYSADATFTTENVTFVETKIGVDGIMSAGYVPTIKTLTATFEASSDTIPKLDALIALCESSKTPVAVVLTFIIPAVSRKFIVNAVLTGGNPLFNATKTLEAKEYVFQFSESVPMPI